MFSTSTGDWFKPQTLRELLYFNVAEMTRQPLLLGHALECLGSTLSGAKDVHIRAIGPTPYLSTVQRTLQNNVPKVTIEEASKVPDTGSSDSDLIAIVGMSGRFPGADNLAEFWSMLEAGHSALEEIPASRFNIDDFYDPSGEGKNTIRTRLGYFLKNPGLFDNRFFQVSPSEALQMDPNLRILLMTAYEALQQAGYSPNATPSTQTARVASFFGQTTSDWNAVM